MIRRTMLPILLVALVAPLGLAQDALDPSVEGRNATLKRAFGPLNQQVAPHVVAVLSVAKTLRGYGVVVPGGVVTSAQVVTANGTYTLRGHTGSEFRSKVVARSTKQDLALLAPVAGLEPIALGADESLTIGQFLLSPGHEGPLAVGVLGAVNRKVQRSLMQKNVLLGLFQDGNEGHTRSYSRVLQHDGLLEGTHLGGPVVDRSGKLVGLNVALPFRGSVHAVQVNEIKALLSEWAEHAVVEEGPAAEGPVELAPVAPVAPEPAPGGVYLGLNADDAPLELVPPTHKHGIAVLGVSEGGPAEAAGLKADDVILELDGKRLDSLDHLGRLLSKRNAGETVELKIMRERRMTSVKLVLGTR